MDSPMAWFDPAQWIGVGQAMGLVHFSWARVRTEAKGMFCPTKRARLGFSNQKPDHMGTKVQKILIIGWERPR